MPAPHRMNCPRRANARRPAMFPHTITLYNVEIIHGPDYDDTIVNHITILRGVFLEACKAINVQKSGLVGADAATLYIPFSVEAVNAVTGKRKRYIPPIEFWRVEDKSGFWTLAITSKEPGVSGNTFFVKGEAVEPDKAMDFIEMKYDHVYDITKIDEKDFGSPDMQHFEVGAN